MELPYSMLTGYFFLSFLLLSTFSDLLHFLGSFFFLASFYIVILLFSFLQAMIIIAWNGGSPSDIFDGGVFKKVLSIFITAAILKLGQGLF